MLPDDYENLSETIIASNLFANNILACITTKNYWDVINKYKPLMHTWYLRVIVQSYFVIAIVPSLAQRNGKTARRSCFRVYLVITVVLLILFLLLSFTVAQKFYYLPFRLFEITAGAALVCWAGKAAISERYRSVWLGAALAVLAAVLLVPQLPFPDAARLLLICAVT